MLHTLTLSQITQVEGERERERKTNKKNRKEGLREEKDAVGGVLFNKHNVLTSLLLG
jgi:hypothetical protein